MTLRGMDVDEVQRIAARLDQAARQVDAVVGAVDSIIRQLDDVWMGDDLTTFHGWWSSTHRPAVSHVSADVAAWTTELRRQAQEQIETSGSTRTGPPRLGGWPGGVPGLGGGRPFDLSRIPDLIAEYGPGAFGILGTLSGSRFAVGRYTKGYAAFLSGLGPKADAFFRYKRSSLLQWIDRGNISGSLPASTRGLIDRGSKLLGGVGVGLSAGMAGAAFERGDMAEGLVQSGTAAASGLKMSKNPVAYLGGVAVQAWTEVGDAARGIDWSPQALRDTVDYAVHNPGEALLAGAQENIKQMPGRLWKIFT